MHTECLNCHHRFNPFNPTNEERQARFNKFDRIFFVVIITSLILATAGFLLYDYYHVTPPSEITFVTVALAASGLKPNTASQPVYDVIFQYTGIDKECLSRRRTIVSSNLTLAKSLEPHAGYICYVPDEVFVIELTGPAISLPNSLDKEITLFDVEMEFRDKDHILRDNFYHVTCKGLTLQMDTPVQCDTTFLLKSSI